MYSNIFYIVLNVTTRRRPRLFKISPLPSFFNKKYFAAPGMLKSLFFLDIFQYF